MEIYSFRLILEGKIGKEILEWSRLEFLGKFLADNLALSDTKGNTTGSLNRGGIAGLLLLRTLFISNLPKVLRATFLGSDTLVLVAYLFKPLALITSLSELYFRFRRFILLVQMKKVISMNYDSSTICWKPWRWVRLGLILTMRDIYRYFDQNPLREFTSSRSTNFKDILQWCTFWALTQLGKWNRTSWDF